MKLDVVNGQVGFVGKLGELIKMERAVTLLGKELSIGNCIEVFECEYTNTAENNYEYDVEEYTVSQVKEIWRKTKAMITKVPTTIIEATEICERFNVDINLADEMFFEDKPLLEVVL